MALAGLVLAGLCTGAAALEFRTIQAPGAVLFDAPSASARRLYILSAGYPVEIVVSVEGWHKVRDAAGGIAWVAADRLSEEKLVMVNVPRAAVRAAAADDAAVLFEAEQGVVLQMLESPPGWLKVRHRDGSTGFVRRQQVWGG